MDEERREQRRRRILRNSEDRLRKIVSGQRKTEEQTESHEVHRDSGSPSSPTGSADNDPLNQTESTNHNNSANLDSIIPDLNNSRTQAEPLTEKATETSQPGVRQRIGTKSSEQSHSVDSTESRLLHSNAYVDDGSETTSDVQVLKSNKDAAQFLGIARFVGSLLLGVVLNLMLHSIGLLMQSVILPFILVEATVVWYQVTHKLHKTGVQGSLLTSALLLNGINKDIIDNYNTTMAIVTNILEDFATVMFSFVLIQAVRS
ncbi:uncharacterized protein LOC106176903 [Lingula anatina]|uniref:Uncharacterized protein LOC106176903 n=1 Tax=Lingula anatina TaxID=7574 RepID=A0A1S3JX43_LINAN|nr:uncharacterized protein LOC106176903 [Lingula anatina]|eukprot:XP_013414948.1 uncharacterized protein LOC106176903 [Lingula anatina]